MTESQDVEAMPTPHPAMSKLERLIGSWELRGRPLGSETDSIRGKTTFRWLHPVGGTGFHLLQEMELDYDGMPIRSHELIGYDDEKGVFRSFVYSNMAPDPWPYEWKIEGDDLTIAISHAPMNATYRGRFAPDGHSFSGGWRPNPGADEVINAPYDVVASRVGAASAKGTEGL